MKNHLVSEIMYPFSYNIKDVPLSGYRGVEWGTLEVFVESQGIDFRTMDSESRFFSHRGNFGPLLSDLVPL